jgi:hypothetical protein
MGWMTMSRSLGPVQPLSVTKAPPSATAGKSEAVERCSVNHSWSAGRELTADLYPDIVTGVNNHVSAKAAHERLV